MRKSNVLIWGLTALLMAANTLHILLQAPWTTYLLVLCAGLYLATLGGYLLWSERRQKQAAKRSEALDRLFFATLENMRLVAESDDLSGREKEQALCYLRDQFWQAGNEEEKRHGRTDTR